MSRNEQIKIAEILKDLGLNDDVICTITSLKKEDLHKTDN